MEVSAAQVLATDASFTLTVELIVRTGLLLVTHILLFWAYLISDLLTLTCSAFSRGGDVDICVEFKL